MGAGRDLRRLLDFAATRPHASLTFPDPFVEVEYGIGIGEAAKIGITGEDPASMLPRTESVGAEPTPQSSAADFRDEAPRNHVLTDLLDGERDKGNPRRWESSQARALTGTTRLEEKRL